MSLFSNKQRLYLRQMENIWIGRVTPVKREPVERHMAGSNANDDHEGG
jgi:hypothetical protein